MRDHFFVLPDNVEGYGQGHNIGALSSENFLKLFAQFKQDGPCAFASLDTMIEQVPKTSAVNSSILYESEKQNVAVIDIPASISLAQTSSPHPSMPWLHGALPVEIPFASCEPKSKKAKAEVLSRNEHCVEDDIYRSLIKQALLDLKHNYSGELCLARHVSPMFSSKYHEYLRALLQYDREHRPWRVQSGAERPVSPMTPKWDADTTIGAHPVLDQSRTFNAHPVQQEPRPISEFSSIPNNPLNLLSNENPLNIADRTVLTNRIIQNPSSETSILTIAADGTRYLVPPRSAFILDDISHDPAQTKHKLESQLARTIQTCTPSAGPAQFDAIIMDPPWDNRSAQRSGGYRTNRQAKQQHRQPQASSSHHHSQPYNQPADATHSVQPPNANRRKHPLDHLSSPASKRTKHPNHASTTATDTFNPFAHLAPHIAPNGLALVWIDNKPRTRHYAINKLFRPWGVELVEEWIWAKVTTKGEPVYDIDGVWRRPWEVCLVGRRREDGGVFVGSDEDEDAVCEGGNEEAEDRHPVDWGTGEVVDGGGVGGDGKSAQDGVKRRVIFAVPDWHSRKPCLKELLDRLLPQHPDVRVLEVYARNLTAGWWAWGDDVLRFQWAGHWTGGEDLVHG